MSCVCIEDSRLFYNFFYISIDDVCEIHVDISRLPGHMAVQHERRTFSCGPTTAGKTL